MVTTIFFNNYAISYSLMFAKKLVYYLVLIDIDHVCILISDLKLILIRVLFFLCIFLCSYIS